MKDALRYELKQILLPLVIFTGVAAAVCLIYSGTQSLEYPVSMPRGYTLWTPA